MEENNFSSSSFEKKSHKNIYSAKADPSLDEGRRAQSRTSFHERSPSMRRILFILLGVGLLGGVSTRRPTRSNAQF
jgi:hypothetical protein